MNLEEHTTYVRAYVYVAVGRSWVWVQEEEEGTGFKL